MQYVQVGTCKKYIEYIILLMFVCCTTLSFLITGTAVAGVAMKTGYKIEPDSIISMPAAFLSFDGPVLGIALSFSILFIVSWLLTCYIIIHHNSLDAVRNTVASPKTLIINSAKLPVNGWIIGMDILRVNDREIPANWLSYEMNLIWDADIMSVESEPCSS